MRTWSDRVLEAQRGFQLLGDIEGSGRALGLETGYVQARVRGRLLLPLWPGASLFLRGEAGSTWTDDFDSLPASRRFFAGGDDSVRGYSYNSLSPIDPFGFASGGKHLLTGSAEFTHKVRGPWGIALFTDSGNAFNTGSDPFKVSVGVGLRWQSPVGMVRIDLAKSLSETDRTPRLHLSVGPEF
jgi:translocation and assembly module TamA